MRTNIRLTLCAILISSACFSQIYISEKSFVSFFSAATLENITAENKKSVCLFDSDKNTIAFRVEIKDFVFDKSLMQEHFNEKYMETEKYPKATFEGEVLQYKKGTGLQQVKAKGKLTIHGVTKDVELAGTIEPLSENKLQIKSKFTVVLEDYKIERPQILWQNIAEKVEVSADFTLKSK